MDNSDFYFAAASVIPLLLIGVMATRSLALGAMSRRPAEKILVLGLGTAVIGEIAVFAFLFFEPVPTAVAVILAAVTWAGLLGQLALAMWWLVGLLIKPERQARVPAGQTVGDPPTVPTTPAEASSRRSAGGNSARAQGPGRRVTTGRRTRPRSHDVASSTDAVTTGAGFQPPGKPPGALPVSNRRVSNRRADRWFCPLCAKSGQGEQDTCPDCGVPIVRR